MTISDPLKGLHPEVRQYAQYAIWYMQLLTGGKWNGVDVVGGVKPTITSGWRSRAKQQELYDARASNPYPVNRPGDSAHEVTWDGQPSALAFDSDVPDEYQPLWRQVREALGFRVPPNDEVHGEVPSWRDIVSQNRSWAV